MKRQFLIATMLIVLLVVAGACASRGRFGSIVVQKISVLDGGVDMLGNHIDLDDDNDTSITADTDDQIDFEIAGADDFVFSANLFESQTGSVVDLNGTKLELDADADTSLTVDTDDQLDFEIAGSDELSLTAATFDYNDTYIDQDVGTENVGVLPTIVSTSVITTTDGAIATIADGEIWFVHNVYCNVTTNFDCAGDDCTLDIGDGNDPDGLLDLDDAELQTSDVDVTNGTAGWQGYGADTIGAYMAAGAGFIYAPSGAAETIDIAVADTGGTDPTAGAATCYIAYTRVQ